MHRGDLLLYYHTGEDKAVVGVAKVLGEPGPDPTSPKEDWASVDVAPLTSFPEQVTLAQIRSTASLKDLSLLTRPRLSVLPVTPAQFQQVLKLGKASLP
jgi:predicted RNA-binding protein with PUA-like domain